MSGIKVYPPSPDSTQRNEWVDGKRFFVHMYPNTYPIFFSPKLSVWKLDKGLKERRDYQNKTDKTHSEQYPLAMTFSTYWAKARIMKEFYGMNSDVKSRCECYDGFPLPTWKNNQDKATNSSHQNVSLSFCLSLCLFFCLSPLSHYSHNSVT